MQEAVPSQTALGTAVIRALHQYVDDRPLIFDDPVSFQLLHPVQQRYIKRLARLNRVWLRPYRRLLAPSAAMRAQVLVRARYADDVLHEMQARGAVRLVIPAAGLDTSSFRYPDLEVIEFDHPATQRWKRELLAQRGIAEPPRVTYVPIDFESTGLGNVWINSASPDYISWLGITYYLTRQALTATLTDLHKLTSPGSELVLDYWCEPPANDASRMLLWGTRIAVALLRERMHSFFDPEQMESLATQCGWQVVENLSSDEQNRRYLINRRDQLRVPSFAWLLRLRHA